MSASTKKQLIKTLPALLIISMLQWPVSAAAGAGAVNLPEPGADENFASGGGDGKKFVEQLRKTIAGFDDYSVDSSLYMYKPNASRVGGGNICWKKVNLVKLTVKSNGIKHGSVVVRTPEGKIRAWGGPNLRFLKMNLSEDSRILQAANGYNAMRSDLGSLLNDLSQALQTGSRARVTSEAVNVPRLRQSLYVLEVFQPREGDVLAQEIFINPANNVPVEWDLFKNGTRFSIATFENFKANIGLDEKQFQI